MSEFLALIGGSWRQLLLYPGMLSGLLMTALMHRLWSTRRTEVPARDEPYRWEPGVAGGAACMLLVLAFLPFPRTYWAYPIDVLTALVLLEVPYWLQLVRRFRSANPASRAMAGAEIGALLNVYLLLALAVAALGYASGSLLLNELKAGRSALRWAGLVTWAVALPPLLGLGPWRLAGRDWLADLRRMAHIALLVALALPAGDEWGHDATAIGAILGFGSLAALDHLWRGAPERWERFQPGVVLLMLMFLLGTNVAALAARLR